MNIDDLTLGQIRQIKSLCGTTEPTSACPYKVGQAYLVRTVTHYYTGLLESVHEHELVLSKAAWIADTGRYATALTSGELSEVEPIIGPVIIGRGAIVDAVQWPNKLPEKQK